MFLFNESNEKWNKNNFAINSFTFCFYLFFEHLAIFESKVELFSHKSNRWSIFDSTISKTPRHNKQIKSVSNKANWATLETVYNG